MDAIQGVASTVGVDDLEVTDVSRIGQAHESRPRLLRFKCNDRGSRMSLLRKAKELRNTSEHRGVYVNPDQTKRQRELSKALRNELRARRDLGEDVVIRHGKIVSKAEQIFRAGF